jgi:phosphate-selective porin
MMLPGKIVRTLLAALAALMVLLAAPTARAAATPSEVDALIQLLISKGLLTVDEAASLRADLAIQKQEEKDKQTQFPFVAGKAMQISGYTQVRYREDPTIADTFDIRRARLDIKGALGAGFDYRLQSEFAGSSAKVLDAAFGWTAGDELKLTAGQFLIPFSQENLRGNTKLETINRSQVVEALVARSKDVIGNHNGRDIGLQASGSFALFGTPGFLDYGVGIFNGAGMNTSDTNERKDFIGHVSVKPVEGFSFGGSVYSGRYTLASAPTRDDLRRRFGAEIAWEGGPFLVKGEYIRGNDGKVEKDGWYALAGWFVLPETIQAVAKYDTFDPNRRTDSNDTDVTTLGLNWYFRKWAFLQLGYEFKHESGRKVANDAATAQLTIQF